jgi:hypothetical protein
MNYIEKISLLKNPNDNDIIKILLNEDCVVDDDLFKALPIITLDILKLCFLKQYKLNKDSYGLIDLNAVDEDYYDICIYLYQHGYNLPQKFTDDAISSIKIIENYL